jgi:HEPN domain-containing protein
VSTVRPCEKVKWFMKPSKAAQILLHKASQDEIVLRRLLHSEEIDVETLGFHAQQAVEKLLKAWLCHLGVDYPKLHNVNLPVDLLEASDVKLPDTLSDLGSLTPFATVYRYDALPMSADIDRERLLTLVLEVRAHVETQIGNDSESLSF